MMFRAWTSVEAQIMGIDRLSSMIGYLRNYLDHDLDKLELCCVYYSVPVAIYGSRPSTQHSNRGDHRHAVRSNYVIVGTRSRILFSASRRDERQSLQGMTK